MRPLPNNKPSSKEGFLSKILRSLNTFKTGFLFGVLATALLTAGTTYLVFNVFRFGQVSFGPNSVGQVGSPVTTTQTDETTIEGSTIEQNNPSNENSENTVQTNDSDISQQESNNDVGSNITAGGDVNLTITYRNNNELPGFDANKGYRSEPPDISQFDDALLISNISFGINNFESLTQDIFILGRKYKSTFFLKPNQTEPTRVAFSLETSPVPTGVFFQFGLADWTSGTTTLTYLVKITADGQLMWSGQIKYAEAQIASVVLDVKGFSDIVFEYQIVETGNANLYQNPLYFTEAKLLFD